MAKKRRPPRQKQPPSDDLPPPPNFARAQTGEVPWTLDGLGAVLAHAAKLHNTPHDDWNRHERGINLQHDDGSLSRLSLNPDMMTNQMGVFIVDELRKQGANPEVITCHLYRFLEAQAFLAENFARIRQEGLIVDDPTDPDASLLSAALVEVLATRSYKGARFQGPDREPVRSFHIDRVIAEAKRRAAEEEDDEGL